MKTIIGALALLSAMPVQSAEWWHVGSAPKNDLIYFADRASVMISGNVTKVWILQILKTEEKCAKYSKILYNIKCLLRSERFESNTIFTKDGVPLITEDTPTEYFSVIPDSVGEKIYNNVCKPITQWGGGEMVEIRGNVHEAAERFFRNFK